MIKSVFALVILLHLCYIVESNINLNKEIMDRLKKLDELNKGKKINFTSSGQLEVPVPRNVTSCVGLFTRLLKDLLNNVGMSEDYTVFLQELKANLKDLEPQQQIDGKCNTTNVNSTRVFGRYIFFLKKLNNQKKG